MGTTVKSGKKKKKKKDTIKGNKKKKNANKKESANKKEKSKKSDGATKTNNNKDTKVKKKKKTKKKTKTKEKIIPSAPEEPEAAVVADGVETGPSEVDKDNDRLLALLHGGEVQSDDELFEDPLKPKPDATVGDGAVAKKPTVVKQAPDTTDLWKTAFFGNLSYDVTEAAMQELLQPYGPTSELRWLEDENTGRFKGCAWVVFEKIEDAKKAIEALHKSQFMGRKLKALLTRDTSTKPNDATKSGFDFAQWQKPQAPVPNYDSVSRCFMGNLPFGIYEDALLEHFQKVNEDIDLENVFLIKDKETGKFYGSAFVTFTDPESAAWAVACSGMPISGRPAKIAFAPPKRRTAALGSGTTGRAAREPTPRPEGGTTTAFFGNLNFAIEDENMHTFCKSAGEVKEIRWLTHRDSGQFKGCGFVEFYSVEAVDAVVKRNGDLLLGRPARIDYA